jgi:hypothetical protein
MNGEKSHVGDRRGSVHGERYSPTPIVYFDANFAPRYADNCVDFDLSAAAK